MYGRNLTETALYPQQTKNTTQTNQNIPSPPSNQSNNNTSGNIKTNQLTAEWWMPNNDTYEQGEFELNINGLTDNLFISFMPYVKETDKTIGQDSKNIIKFIPLGKYLSNTNIYGNVMLQHVINVGELATQALVSTTNAAGVTNVDPASVNVDAGKIGQAVAEAEKKQKELSTGTDISFMKMPVPKSLTDKIEVNYGSHEYLSSSVAKNIGKFGFGQALSTMGVSQATKAFKLFEGFNEIDFNFEWEFWFQSKEEADAVMNVANFFKKLCAFPGKKLRTGTSASSTFGENSGLASYDPVFWKIQLNWKGIQDVHKFPEFVLLSNIEINFGDNELNPLKVNHPPLNVNLSLNFVPATSLGYGDIINKNSFAASQGSTTIEE